MFSLGSVAAIGYTQLPLLLVGVLTTTRDTGLFSAGFRLLIAFIGALGILWWPLMPVLTRESPDTPVFRDVLGSSAALVLALSTPIALALSIFPAAVLRWLFGADYAAGALPLAIGAWVLPLYALTGLLEQTSLALGRERMRAGVAWTTLGVMAVLGWGLMPRFGALGAAATATAGFALALALFAGRLRSRIRLGDVFRPLLRVGAACVPPATLWLVGPRLVSLPVWLWLAAGAALYLPLALGLGLLRLAPGLGRWTPTRAPRAADRRPDPRLVPPGFPRPALEEQPRVSVILAVRDEERFIGRALDAVRAQSYPSDRIEILVVDGESRDRTRDVVEAAAMRDPRVRLLHNPLRRVAGGLNVGLRAARGDVIVRVDGHCVIPPDYLATCVRLLRSGQADCAGGPVRAEGETAMGRAIAMAMSTPFGVGGASFRWASVEREVDHLPFGAWRRQVFETIGLFDETLVRNQDDELSDRLRRAGGRIVMHPGISVRYFSRTSLTGLWRQYRGYGYWKVRVIRKRGGWPSSPRHLVPAAFVCAALGALLVAAWSRSWVPPACVLGPYAAFLLAAALQLSATRRDRVALLVPGALATMHVAYGVGFLRALATPPDSTCVRAPERERRAA
jgi:GT2 family glycosyltransferase